MFTFSNNSSMGSIQARVKKPSKKDTINAICITESKLLCHFKPIWSPINNSREDWKVEKSDQPRAEEKTDG